METRSEKLLQELVDKERGVVAKVEAAKREAEEIVAKARAEAEQMVEQAREQAQKLAQDQAEVTRAEEAEARGEILSRAQSVVESAESAARSRSKAAVKLVVERVLP